MKALKRLETIYEMEDEHYRVDSWSVYREAADRYAATYKRAVYRVVKSGSQVVSRIKIADYRNKGV